MDVQTEAERIAAHPPPSVVGVYTTMFVIQLPLSLLYLSLFFIRRKAHPVSSRNPVLAVPAGTMAIILMTYFMLNRVEAWPCLGEQWMIWPVMFTVIGLNLARVWQIFFKSQTTAAAVSCSEDVKLKLFHHETTLFPMKRAWYLNHRKLSSNSFLFGVLAVAFVIESGIPLWFTFALPQMHVYPRPRTFEECGNDTRWYWKMTAYLIVFGVIFFMACFLILACLLRKVKESLHLKDELKIMGIIGIIGAVVWFILTVVPKANKLGNGWPISSMFFYSALFWPVCVSLAYSVHLSTYAYSTAPREHFYKFDTPRFNTFVHFATILCGGRICRKWKKKNREHRRMKSNQTEAHTRTHTFTSKVEISTMRSSEHAEGKSRNTRHADNLALEEFLAYPGGYDAFQGFLVEEFSVENLLFWHSVRELEKLAGGGSSLPPSPIPGTRALDHLPVSSNPATPINDSRTISPGSMTITAVASDASGHGSDPLISPIGSGTGSGGSSSERQSEDPAVSQKVSQDLANNTNQSVAQIVQCEEQEQKEKEHDAKPGGDGQESKLEAKKSSDEEKPVSEKVIVESEVEAEKVLALPTAKQQAAEVIEAKPEAGAEATVDQVKIEVSPDLAAEAKGAEADRLKVINAAKAIYDNFIGQNAPLQVNISFNVAGVLHTKFSKLAAVRAAWGSNEPLSAELLNGVEIDKNTFSAAKREVWELMGRDTFRRFGRTTRYKDVAQKILHDRAEREHEHSHEHELYDPLDHDDHHAHSPVKSFHHTESKDDVHFAPAPHK